MQNIEALPKAGLLYLLQYTFLIKKAFPGAQVIIHQDPYGLHENRLDYAIDGKCDL